MTPNARSHHRAVLALALLVIGLAFAMTEVAEGQVAVRGFTEYSLPTACASRKVLGIRCPGCGLTRSFIHLAEGDWRASVESHRLGWLLAVLVLIQIPYRLIALWRGWSTIPARWSAGLAVAMVALLILNWLAEVVTGRMRWL